MSLRFGTLMDAMPNWMDLVNINVATLFGQQKTITIPQPLMEYNQSPLAQNFST